MEGRVPADPLLLDIKRLLEAQIDTHYAVGVETDITATNYVNIAISGLTATSADAEDIPDKDVHLWACAMLLSDGGAAAITVTWQLMQASNSVAITPEISTPLLPATLTDGSIVALIDVPFRRFSGIGTTGTIYWRGTADQDVTLQPFVTFVTKTRPDPSMDIVSP